MILALMSSLERTYIEMHTLTPYFSWLYNLSYSEVVLVSALIDDAFVP